MHSTLPHRIDYGHPPRYGSRTSISIAGKQGGLALDVTSPPRPDARTHSQGADALLYTSGSVAAPRCTSTCPTPGPAANAHVPTNLTPLAAIAVTRRFTSSQ